MELLTAYYGQWGKNEVSLLLQQYCYRQTQILFTCICAGTGKCAGRAGGYMAEQMLQWFRGLSFKKLCRNQEKSISWLEESLYEVIQRIDRELENSKIMGEDREVDLAGIFCMENGYLMIGRGAGRICLINTAFGRVHLQYIYKEDRKAEGGKREDGKKKDGKEEGEKRKSVMVMEQGILQPDIAVLFAMESFYQHVTEEMVRDGLAVGDIVTEEQMDRHLKELGREGERLGGTNMGAVLLRTR